MVEVPLWVRRSGFRLLRQPHHGSLLGLFARQTEFGQALEFFVVSFCNGFRLLVLEDGFFGRLVLNCCTYLALSTPGGEHPCLDLLTPLACTRAGGCFGFGCDLETSGVLGIQHFREFRITEQAMGLVRADFRHFIDHGLVEGRVVVVDVIGERLLSQSHAFIPFCFPSLTLAGAFLGLLCLEPGLLVPDLQNKLRFATSRITDFLGKQGAFFPGFVQRLADVDLFLFQHLKAGGLGFFGSGLRLLLLPASITRQARKGLAKFDPLGFCQVGSCCHTIAVSIRKSFDTDTLRGLPRLRSDLGVVITPAALSSASGLPFPCSGGCLTLASGSLSFALSLNLLLSGSFALTCGSMMAFAFASSRRAFACCDSFSGCCCGSRAFASRRSQFARNTGFHSFFSLGEVWHVFESIEPLRFLQGPQRAISYIRMNKY